MMLLARHLEKWSGWYCCLAAIGAWLFLLALIAIEGWIR